MLAGYNYRYTDGWKGFIKPEGQPSLSSRLEVRCHRKIICVKKPDDSYEEEMEENWTRNGFKTNELLISLLGV
jgi:hypothetical protein